jgi:glycosyltransferase involved in cell wall biosynthesis
MRIAHVTATFRPYHAGTGNVCYYNARELVRRGHSVDVFTAAFPGAPEAETLEGIRVRRLRAVLRVGNAPLLPTLVRSLNGYDLLHLHYPFILGAEMVRLASALSGTPFVVSFHNDLIGEGSRQAVFSLYQRLSACLTVRGASRLCAVSLDHYRSSLLSRSLVRRRDFAVEVPNGVDVQQFHPLGPGFDLSERYGGPNNSQPILFIAALDRAHHFKGLDRLLQAMRYLPPEVWLLVVGDGDQRSRFEHEASDLGLEARVVFAGAVTHENTPPLFRGASLTVLPSSPPESFGLVLIESLACGTPVVASDIAGVRTVVNQGVDGLLVDSRNPKTLAGAIERIWNDEPLRQAMGQQGRAKVENRYAWPRVGDRLEGVYLDVLRTRQSHTRLAKPRVL